MTSPVSPAQPLAPCPFCGDARPLAQLLDDHDSVRCSNASCQLYYLEPEFTRAIWNRRAAPPAPAGEVGELVKWLEGRAVADELRDNPDGAELCRRAAAALTAQAAALEEAEGKGDDLAKALRATAEGAAHYMNKFMAAEAALRDPLAVRVNMLRGTIATPAFVAEADERMALLERTLEAREGTIKALRELLELENAHLREANARMEEALLALGCRMGEGGVWEKTKFDGACKHCGKPWYDCDNECNERPICCPACNTDSEAHWYLVPISAPAKGEGET